MRTGFIFNGKHTKEFEGVTVKTKDRPLFPSVKEQVFSSDDMDGEYDFSDIGGHEYYNTRTFQIEFAVAADNLPELQRKLSQLSLWFKGRGTLIFDDIPFVKWNARVVDSVSYMPEHGGKKALLTVSYKAQPFSELIFDTLNGPCLDSEIELDTPIPIMTSAYYMFAEAGTYKNVPNVGDVSVKPIITVTGARGTTKIAVNGTEISVNYSGDYIIDCEKEQVYNSSINLMKQTTGSFFELQPGTDNVITLSGTAAIQINYTPKYLYSVDLENMKWEE